MKNIFKAIVATTLVLLAAESARAEGYIGGSIGHTATEPAIAEDRVSAWNASQGYFPANCDTLNCYSEQDPSAGLKIFGGYRVNPYFAVEGFLAHLGSYDSYAEDGWGTSAWVTANVGTIGVAAVGMYPISQRVSLIGKLGLHSWWADGDYYVLDTSAGLQEWGTVDASGTGGMGGIGVEIGFGERAAMRVEFEYFGAQTDYTDFGIGFLSVGGMYKF